MAKKKAPVVETPTEVVADGPLPFPEPSAEICTKANGNAIGVERMKALMGWVEDESFKDGEYIEESPAA